MIEHQDGSFHDDPEAFFSSAHAMPYTPSSLLATNAVRALCTGSSSTSLATSARGERIRCRQAGSVPCSHPGLSGGIDAYVRGETSLEFVPGDSITFEVPSTSTGATPRTVKGAHGGRVHPRGDHPPRRGAAVPVQWAERDSERPLLAGQRCSSAFGSAGSLRRSSTARSGACSSTTAAPQCRTHSWKNS